MRYTGHVRNAGTHHLAEVAVGSRRTPMPIAARASGKGSSVSGGELLMLALATCYCNDVYREAARMGIEVTSVDVECGADFNTEGEPASNVSYTARITAKAPAEAIRDLAARVDARAEIQNTVRGAIPVKLELVEAVEA